MFYPIITKDENIGEIWSHEVDEDKFLNGLRNWNNSLQLQRKIFVGMLKVVMLSFYGRYLHLASYFFGLCSMKQREKKAILMWIDAAEKVNLPE